MGNLRLDEWLVQNRHYPSRARARDAILRGCVSMGGQKTAKPSRTVMHDDTVEIDDPALRYVSRAALKLVHALDATGYSPKGKTCLDIGASTGGFCQVLLQRDAQQVFAIDVGHGQMAETLLADPRLMNLEGVNARELTPAHLENNAPQFITCDVSFISLKLALPAALQLAANGAVGIFLVKPQFEVGREALGKGGIVRDPALPEATARDLKDWLDNQPAWQVTDFMPSPIKGGDGNREYLLAAQKNG